MNDGATAGGLVRLFSDEKLTRRAVGGDERAFAAIFRRYHQSLYRFCLAIVGNPEDAQDALQNTMIKVLRALPGEERTIDLKPWLYRIAHNESIDLLRRRRESRELDVEQVAPGYGLAEDAATRDRLRRLIADLKELPERQREVLVMRELSGLDFDEIATALETSAPVARQTLYEARQSLRQMEAGREMSCAAVTKALSDGDGRITRRRDVRAHLRSCAGCRAFRDEIKSRERDLAALLPLPLVAAAGMLHGLLGGSQAAGGGSLAATLGGGAAKSIGASAAAKGLATAAVVAAIGVTAADRTGVIQLGLPGEERSAATRAPATPGTDSVGSADGSPAANGSGSTRGDAAGAVKSGVRPLVRRVGQSRAVHGTAIGDSTRHGRQGQQTPAVGGEVPGYGPGAEHPSGRGHEKQHPPAATKGQETAAAHHAGPPGSSGNGKGKHNGKGKSGGKGKHSGNGKGGGNGAPGSRKAATPAQPPPPDPSESTTPAAPEEAPANPPQAAPESPAPAPAPAAEPGSPES